MKETKRTVNKYAPGNAAKKVFELRGLSRASMSPASREVSFHLSETPSISDAECNGSADNSRNFSSGRNSSQTPSKQGSSKRLNAAKSHTASKETLVQDETEEYNYHPNMRRRTLDDVTLDDVNHRRWSTGGVRHTNHIKRSVNSLREGEKAKGSGTNLLHTTVVEDQRAKQLLQKFRFLIRLDLLLRRWWKKHCHSEVSQTHPFYMQYQMINDVADVPDTAMEFKASYFKANKQMRMSQEAVRILSMKSEERSADEVYYAMIALRGIDCIADYPLRMQEALARHGMFQSFGPKRIIVKQGHPPVYFYFILYGTVVVATLETGEPYAKTRVTLRRGENFGADELAIAHRIPRQSTVLTMEYTEFLTIDCDTYENIFMAGGVKTINDPDHNNFMRSLFFLRDWPVELLQSNPKAMEFCYFRRNTVMVKDSNMSEWIYIVKSGSLRVYKKLLKCYPTINNRTGNYMEQAHTDGYYCFMSQESDYHRYAMYNHVHLPPPLGPDSEDEDEEHIVYKVSSSGNVEEKENLLALPLMQRVERLIRPRTASGVIATYGHSKFERSAKRNVQSAKSDGPRLQKIIQRKTPTPRTVSSFSTGSTSDTTIDLSTPTPENRDKRTLLDDFESSARLKNVEHEKKLMTSERATPTVRLLINPDVNPHAISTRQHVFVTDVKREVTAADLDPEFVLVQTLTKGQAFGIQQVLLENQPSMILVSGGAECVMLNKKFYKEHIDPNTLQKLKQQISPYPSDEDLQKNLQIRVNWLKYKAVTLKKLVSAQGDGKAPKFKPTNRRLVFK